MTTSTDLTIDDLAEVRAYLTLFSEGGAFASELHHLAEKGSPRIRALGILGVHSALRYLLSDGQIGKYEYPATEYDPGGGRFFETDSSNFTRAPNHVTKDLVSRMRDAVASSCAHDDVEWVYETHPVCRRCGAQLMES
jgi:hypothetical protein